MSRQIYWSVLLIIITILLIITYCSDSIVYEFRKREISAKRVIRDIDQIMEVINSHQSGIENCYLQQKDILPPTGSIKLKMYIDIIGRVDSVALLQSSFFDPRIDSCIIERVQRWRFDPLHSLAGIEQVIHEFNFDFAEITRSRYSETLDYGMLYTQPAGSYSPGRYSTTSDYGGGPRSRQDIQRVIDIHRDAIEYCYKRSVRLNPNLKGRLTVEFIIAYNGRVKSARIVQSILRDRRLERCIVQRIRRWRFRPIDRVQGDTRVRQTFSFGS